MSERTDVRTDLRTDLRTTTPLSGARRLAFLGVVLGTVGIAVAYATAFAPPEIARMGPWLMALALPVCLVAVMTLGAVRNGQRVGALAVPFAVVFVLVAGGFAFALSLPPDAVGSVFWLGLPKRAAVIIYGVGLLPLFILPMAYALTFDALTLSDADIDRVRAARDHVVSRSHEGHR